MAETVVETEVVMEVGWVEAATVAAMMEMKVAGLLVEEETAAATEVVDMEETEETAEARVASSLGLHRCTKLGTR